MTEERHVQLRAPAQDPDAVLDYRIEFDELIASLPDGVSLIGCTWAVVPITGDARPLVIVAQANAADLAYTELRLSLGTLTYDYRVRAVLSYSDGEIDPLSFMIEIGYT